MYNETPCRERDLHTLKNYIYVMVKESSVKQALFYFIYQEE